ncbi:MAG: insulinase family protein [Chlamydiia bacterium]|nr:insulinase family protein [Chlamydiia bacterium]
MKKSIFALFVVLTLAGEALFTADYVLVDDRSELAILTPVLKNRQTEKIRLNNGLEAYLISDPDTTESGAALSVGVGTWDDPEARPGMAHFVEHMLFMGTKKYPDENGYSRFLDAHGGKRNAFTMTDRTVYMFSIEAKAFDQALDRFSQFFISPLFNSSGVDRELKAIDQEFSKNILIEFWRILHVKKELANRDHPFHRFDIGNQETLKHIQREELVNWFDSHYTAEKMHLVVLSPLPLEKLKTKVVETFSLIKQRDVSLYESKIPIFSPITKDVIVAVEPLHESQALELSWELPQKFGEDKEIKAEQLISYVLGHEGDFSLLAKLKKKGLAYGLNAGLYQAGKNQVFLNLQIDLTDQGITKVEEVITASHQAISTLRHIGIPRYIYDEAQQIAKLNYIFQTRKDVFDEITEYAYMLVEEDLTTFPQKSIMPTRFDPQITHELLSVLIPEHCRYTLVAPLEHSNWKRELWMGVSYALLPISSQTLEEWKKIAPDYQVGLPFPNRFIPNNLSVREKEIVAFSPLPKPFVTIDEEKGRLFTTPDDRFLIPKMAMEFVIHTPNVCEADPKSLALADLYCTIIKQRLTPLAYEAALGGLDFLFTPSRHGIALRVKGYDEKVLPFLEKMIGFITTVSPTPEEYILFKDMLVREYHNEGNTSPLSQGSEIVKSILYKNYSGPLEKLNVMSEITYEDLLRFKETLWDKTYIEGMTYGDFSQQEIQTLFALMTDAFQKEPYAPHLHPEVALAEFSEELGPSFLVRKTPLEGNAVILTLDCGHFSFKREAALNILTKSLEEPFFSELRTRQQTAYLVGNWSKEMERHLYTFFAIQSNTHQPRDLLARFELFIEESLTHMKTTLIPEERFESIKEAMIAKLRIPPKSFAQMCRTLALLGFEYDADFNWHQKQIKGLESLTYEEFLSLSREFLGANNVKRIAVFVEGESMDRGLTYKELATHEHLRREISYKSRTK